MCSMWFPHEIDLSMRYVGNALFTHAMLKQAWFPHGIAYFKCFHRELQFPNGVRFAQVVSFIHHLDYHRLDNWMVYFQTTGLL